MSNVFLYLVVIFILVVLQFFPRNVVLNAVFTLLAVALVAYNLLKRQSKSALKKVYLDNITFNFDETKRAVTQIPLPMVILNVMGDIFWCNKEFNALTGDNSVNQNISKVVPDIHMIELFENKDKINLTATIAGKQMQVIGCIIETKSNNDSDYIITLYFIDRTTQHNVIQKLENQRTLCCLLQVDNYDDLIKNTPESEHTSLIAEIDRRINSWVVYMSGVSRKYEKDKFLIIFDYENYKRAVEGKFNIIESIHEINVKNRIPVTLSIGVGNGDSLTESMQFAQVAIDMALGRGGDQVVVKSEEEFVFFGGNSEAYEKNTRVKARVVAYALRELISASDCVFVLMHKRPDMDSFGAAIGISRIAKELNKTVYIVFNIEEGTISEVTSLFNNEEYSSMFVNEQNAISLCSKKSLAIVVDTHNPYYVEASRLLSMIPNRVLIDHHRQSTNFVDNLMLVYHEPYASSSCEMVTEIIQYVENARHNLTVLEAQALYIGIMLDTKNFTSKAGVRTFEAAAYLRRFGIDSTAVKRIFQSDLDSYIKRARIVERTEIIGGICAVSCWDRNEQHRANILCSQAADELLNIQGVEASFVLCRSEDTILVSARSLGSYNVQLVMEAMGGGGHLSGAGAQLKDTTMSVAYEKLKKLLTTK